jgi:hypothetical protein
MRITHSFEYPLALLQQNERTKEILSELQKEMHYLEPFDSRLRKHLKDTFVDVMRHGREPLYGREGLGALPSSRWVRPQRQGQIEHSKYNMI